jgi:cation transport ATPase
MFAMCVYVCLHVFSAEKASEHPLARAIVAYAEESNITGDSRNTIDSTVVPQQQFLSIQDGTFKAVSGKGLSCIVDGHTVAVGSPSFVQQHVTAYAGTTTAHTR